MQKMCTSPHQPKIIWHVPTAHRTFKIQVISIKIKCEFHWIDISSARRMSKCAGGLISVVIWWLDGRLECRKGNAILKITFTAFYFVSAQIECSAHHTKRWRLLLYHTSWLIANTPNLFGIRFDYEMHSSNYNYALFICETNAENDLFWSCGKSNKSPLQMKGMADKLWIKLFPLSHMHTRAHTRTYTQVKLVTLNLNSIKYHLIKFTRHITTYYTYFSKHPFILLQ